LYFLEILEGCNSFWTYKRKREKLKLGCKMWAALWPTSFGPA
jgi:hypothetical protein